LAKYFEQKMLESQPKAQETQNIALFPVKT